MNYTDFVILIEKYTHIHVYYMCIFIDIQKLILVLFKKCFKMYFPLQIFDNLAAIHTKIQ